MNPAKIFIPDKYNNQMELKKIKRKMCFTKELMELRSWSFSEEEVSSCSNIPSAAEMLVVWHKAMPTYREGGTVYM